mmetsp:Transcript_34971/g.31519  ORF Transcript_34971/g.31519 Transcript_34971/m.31519 type:complete len:111 (-) Transcript_34971:106-438(-)
MGAKKKRAIHYAGSLMTHRLKFIVEAKFSVASGDRRSGGVAYELYKLAACGKKFMYQPNFVYTLEYIDAPSGLVYLKWVNGFEYTFKTAGKHGFLSLLENVDLINYFCEQ